MTTKTISVVAKRHQEAGLSTVQLMHSVNRMLRTLMVVVVQQNISTIDKNKTHFKMAIETKHYYQFFLLNEATT